MFEARPCFFFYIARVRNGSLKCFYKRGFIQLAKLYTVHPTYTECMFGLFQS